MNIEFAKIFATKWVAAWNAHDIDRIMTHYADDIIIVSPIAGRLLGHSEVIGIEAVKDYFLKGLQVYPDLHFQILDILCGENSIILYYINQQGIKAGEYMQFNHQKQVHRMRAHYGSGSQ